MRSNETSRAYSLTFVSLKPILEPLQPERVERETPPRYLSPSESVPSQRSPSPDAQLDVFDPPEPMYDLFRSPSPDGQHPQNLQQVAQQDHENHPEPPNDRLPSPDRALPAVYPQRRHGEARNIIYDRRQPPVIDLEALSHLAVLPKLRETLEFVNHVRNASLEDPIAKFTPAMLERLRNPPEAPIQLNDPGIRHSISTYLALENASQAAYERVIKSTKQNFPDAPGANNCIKFQAVEKLIASYTGIEPIEHDMCIDSCIGFTGPFSELTECPRCGKTRWDEAKLEATNGRVKIPAKRFTTLPLGPQLQAMYRNPESARDMRYLYERTQQVLDEYEEKNKISIINDIAASWDYLGSSLAGDISENDVVVMASLDGAQIYEDKDSDCWLYIWVIINLTPNKRYRKTHVLPGGFIPGPQKPKVIDSFMVVGLHHLSALQAEGLKVWDSSRQETLHSNVFFLFTTADGPGLVYWDGLVGHCGKNGCRLYCGVRGRHKDARSHYYPALLRPHNGPADSDHPDHSAFEIPPAGSQEYTANLIYLISAPNQRQFELRRTETGITKAPLILGLDPMHSLGVPLCMTPNIMHLTANLSDLLISLWRGTITCMNNDNINTWDWAVFRDEQIWKAHGHAVEEAGCYLPGSFGMKPHNIEDKLNSGYKTWEFFLYTFGLLPGLLHGLLPEPYWSNFCKLVRGFQLICKHQLTHEEVLEACVLLAAWEREFEEIYYQRRNDRIHFIRPCVHQVLHLAPETFQKGPLICTAQWTIERTIGNLKQQIRQPSNYLVNFAKEGVRRARVNALLAALPELDNSQKGLPSGALDLGGGYALLRKRDKSPVYPSHGTGGAILDFLDRQIGPLPKIRRWARLLLPHGQIVHSAWRETLRATDKLRASRMVKVAESLSLSFLY